MLEFVTCSCCVDFMKDLPDNYIDLTVTSPPYDNLRKYNGFTFDFENTALQLYRVTKPGGVVVWVVGDATIKGSETGTSFRQALFFMRCGFNPHDTMIYAKSNFIPLTHNRYEQGFEFIFVFSKGKPATFNGLTEISKTSGYTKNYAASGSNTKEGGYRRRNEVVITKHEKLRTNIFYYSTGNNLTKHPAPFPEKLAEDHILSWSNAGDLIFDPFTGSGTTGKIALLNDRRFIGCEISQEYTDLANNRINAAYWGGL